MVKYTPEEDDQDKPFEEFLTSNRITFTFVWNKSEDIPEYLIHSKEHQTLIELKFFTEPKSTLKDGIRVIDPKRKFIYITPEED